MYRDIERRLDATRGSGGSAWLTCCPTTPYTRITNAEFYLSAAGMAVGVQYLVHHRGLRGADVPDLEGGEDSMLQRT